MSDKSIILSDYGSESINLDFTINRKDVAGGKIELHKTALSGHIEVTVDGQKVQRLKEEKAPFPIKMKDGSVKKLTLKMRLLDPVPSVYLDGEEILLARKLLVVECVFAFLPIMMFLIHGPIATVLAFFVLLANFRILRLSWMPTVRWAAIYALSIILYWALALLLRLFLK